MSDIKDPVLDEQTEPAMSEAEMLNRPEIQRKTLKLSLKALVTLFLAMLAIIICLAVTTIILALKMGSEGSETDFPVIEDEYIPVINDRVYDFYSEDEVVILDDPYYGEIWLRAFGNVPKVSFDYSGLVLEENGRYTYSEDGEVVSRTGIDVSYHQHDIDWEKVAEDGIDFAIIRIGYRGYESGLLNLDENFHRYMKGAIDAGLDVGVYFFSQALNAREAVEEANFVMENIRGYDLTFPIVYDWEIMEYDSARTNGIHPYTVTECAAAFCDTIKDGGYNPMVYGSRRFALMKLDMSRLPDVDFWFAEYKDGHNEPSYPYDFQIWQYASDGRVDGIEGDVDLNICFVDYGNAQGQNQ
ncbi:MAG: glycoside hydrolase family 25 protein [Oscillospiraceae bacterium]|nr:glycoside hydrolase family 25 protein [Oscillospiraceae bacterium]